jgi:hypothetical protein
MKAASSLVEFAASEAPAAAITRVSFFNSCNPSPAPTTPMSQTTRHELSFSSMYFLTSVIRR